LNVADVITLVVDVIVKGMSF